MDPGQRPAIGGDPVLAPGQLAAGRTGPGPHDDLDPAAPQVQPPAPVETAPTPVPPAPTTVTPLEINDPSGTAISYEATLVTLEEVVTVATPLSSSPSLAR